VIFIIHTNNNWIYIIINLKHLDIANIITYYYDSSKGTLLGLEFSYNSLSTIWYNPKQQAYCNGDFLLTVFA
jgi:hypothetical protein